MVFQLQKDCLRSVRTKNILPWFILHHLIWKRKKNLAKLIFLQQKWQKTTKNGQNQLKPVNITSAAKFTFFLEIFLYRYGWLFHKKYFMFPIRGGNMDCFKYERFLWKVHERLFLALFAVYTGKKKRIREKVWIWQHCNKANNAKKGNATDIFIILGWN
jgi:hypothetical protein